jgi:hypothetical protein
VLVDVASGVVLLGGAGACAAATVRRGFSVAPIAFAAALMAAVFEDGLVVACALAVAGTAALVLDRMPGVTLFSWLDAGLCGTAVAALAVALGADAAPAVAAGGAVGALALSRWQPGWALPVAIGGLGGLAAGAVGAPLAAFGLAGASWLREPPAKPGPEFSRVVLVAILIGASTALALLGVGQFTELSAVAVGLAIATVLAGMARAGMTVTERLRESHQKAVTDDLTGLGNRRHLVDRLEAAIESTAARDGSLALLLVDLDGFKELNDTLGHSAGDEVLRQIGPRLAQILREQDTLARLGAGRRGDRKRRRPAAARRARAVVPGRGHPLARGRQHRHRAVPAARARRPRAAPARGRRDVRGQAHAHGPRGLPRRPRSPQSRPASAHRRAPQRPAGRPARPPLPAEGGPADGRHHRRRGARALGPSGPGVAGCRALPAPG